MPSPCAFEAKAALEIKCGQRKESFLKRRGMVTTGELPLLNFARKRGKKLAWRVRLDSKKEDPQVRERRPSAACHLLTREGKKPPVRIPAQRMG